MIQALDAEMYFNDLKRQLSSVKIKSALYQTIVDAPFRNRAMTAQMGLGIIVLLLVDKDAGTIDRIALARTDLAQGTLDMSAKPFREIKIPIQNRDNYIAIAIRRRHHMITSDWQYLFTPALTPEESRLNQAGGGIACSVIYPLADLPDGGALIFSYYEPPSRIGKEHHDFMAKYCRLAEKELSRL